MPKSGSRRKSEPPKFAASLAVCCSLRSRYVTRGPRRLPQRNRIAFSGSGPTRKSMYFASDNTAGMTPEILEAIGRANVGYALGYGNDDWTKRVERRFAEIFEKEVAMFLVPTGTVANALAIAHLTPPWGAVLCHAESHIATDECGAPELFGGGTRLIGLKGDGAKISAATLRDALEHGQWGGPHHVSPSVLSLSQATECGTIYRVAETKELADIAHTHGMTV